jgi:hypothetical protein
MKVFVFVRGECPSYVAICDDFDGWIVLLEWRVIFLILKFWNSKGVLFFRCVCMG